MDPPKLVWRTAKGDSSGRLEEVLSLATKESKSKESGAMEAIGN